METRRLLIRGRAANAIAYNFAFCGLPRGCRRNGCTIHCPGSAQPNRAEQRSATFGAYGLDSPDDPEGSWPKQLLSAVSTGRAPSPVSIRTWVPCQYQSAGRSVYNGLDIKLAQNVSHPFKGVKYVNFQFSYSLSRFDNSGSNTCSRPGSRRRSGFRATHSTIAIRNALSGRGSLDRTHQFNIGGYADLPFGFRLRHVSTTSGRLLRVRPSLRRHRRSCGDFPNRLHRHRQVGNPLPPQRRAHRAAPWVARDSQMVDAFMRSIGPAGLTNAINNYNTNISGHFTPAGQTLVNAGLVTLAHLHRLRRGGSADRVPHAPTTLVYGWLKDFDTEVSWVGHACMRG